MGCILLGRVDSKLLLLAKFYKRFKFWYIMEIGDRYASLEVRASPDLAIMRNGN